MRVAVARVLAREEVAEERISELWRAIEGPGRGEAGWPGGGDEGQAVHGPGGGGGSRIREGWGAMAGAWIPASPASMAVAELCQN